MSTIDDIGYPPQRLPTPETNERYVLKGPTKSPPPIFMPKPVYAVAPTQKLVQQQLRLQQQQQQQQLQQKDQDHHTPLSPSALVNTPKPMSATAASTTASNPANNASTNNQPRTLQQQQAAGSSSRQLHSPSVRKPPYSTGSKVTFDTLDSPVQKPPPQSHQNQLHPQQPQLPQRFSPEYDAVVKQNEILRRQVLMLTREKQKMEHERHLVADRLENLERQILEFGFLRPFGNGGPDGGGGDGGGADIFSENSTPVSPTYSRSAPTTTTRGPTRRPRQTGGGISSAQYHHHHHHHHHRSRSVPREDIDTYPSRSRRPQSYDNYYDDSGRDYGYYSPSEVDEDEDEDGSAVEDEDEEDWVEDEYPRRAQRGQGTRRPPPNSRSRSTRPPPLVQPPAVATAALLPMAPPVTSRRPPTMHPGRYPGTLVPPAPSMAGMRAAPGLMGNTGRNPDRRPLRHRHSGSLYRLPPQPAAARWRGEYDEDYMYDSYDDDDADYHQARYRRSNGGAGNRPRYI